MIGTICIMTIALTEGTQVTLTLGGICFIIYYVAQFIKKLTTFENNMTNMKERLDDIDKEVKRLHDSVISCNWCQKKKDKE